MNKLEKRRFYRENSLIGRTLVSKTDIGGSSPSFPETLVIF